MSWLRVVLVAAMTLAFAFAGCTADDESPLDRGAASSVEEPTDVEDTNETVDVPPLPVLTAHGCGFHLGLFAVPTGEAAAGLPEGFRPAPFTSLTLSVQDPTGQSAGIIFVVQTCANGTWYGGSFENMLGATAAVAVVPPEAFRETGISQYYIGPLVASDAAVGALFEEWGVGGTGTVGHELLAEQGTVRAVRSSMSYGGASFTMTNAFAAPPSTRPEIVVRFFAVEGGEVTGWVDVTLAGGSQSLGQTVLQASGGAGPFARPAFGGLAVRLFGDNLSFQYAYTAWNGTAAA